MIIFKKLINKFIYLIFKSRFLPGHHCSPIISKSKILSKKNAIFNVLKKEINGIELNENKQLELLKEMHNKYYHEIPFGDTKREGLRYFYNNPFYSYSDGILLYSVVRYFQPKNIIEVGSGFSSSAMLDINEMFFNNEIKCTFIEPYPKRLLSLLNENDQKNNKIIVSCVQDVTLDLFGQLNENDILFIDSSHVSKTGSDVNHILFNILPKLNKGVLIHFHDIFYPFEYPMDWVLGGTCWNESYLLRAFLSNNSEFKIVLFNTFLEHYHEEWFNKNMPLCLKDKGSSIWIQNAI